VATVRANVLVLALCQALAMTGMNILTTTSSLVGFSLAPDHALATLPQALSVTGTMLLTIPASLLMARIGRRGGFTAGALIGLVGASLATAAIFSGSFLVFCAGTMLIGAYNGFALFYRFAAADIATGAFKAKAISLVLAGGVVSATFGPELAKWSRELFSPVLFAGCYLLIAGLCVLATLLVQLIRIPRPATPDFLGGRPLREIARQPGFIVAVLSGMIAYGVMSLVMTSTPLAMTLCEHPFESAALVIQWHALGMYAPSFVTGSLIARFGLVPMMTLGALLIGACVAVDLSGLGLLQFWLGLLLLGVGWNFLFVGASTLLTQCYAPAERSKVQAANDFLVFGMTSVASFSSGALLGHLGWAWVNLAVVPFVLLALVVVLLRGRRLAPA
jgi:MFS family permease